MAALSLLGGCTREAPTGDSSEPLPTIFQVPTSRARQDELTTRCSDYSDTKNVYWGDLHTHTAYSVDAYSFRTRNLPEDAYAFARGATRQIAAGDSPDSGPFVALAPSRLLDFDAVTDHSEWLPTSYGCGAGTDGGLYDPSSPYADSGACSFYRSDRLTFATAFSTQTALCGSNALDDPDCALELRSGWQAIQQAANTAYVPCTFTTFNGYEWTRSGEGGTTLHRNVIFSSAAVPPIPYTSLDPSAQDPVQLWTQLDTNCLEDAGCEALTIPHNTNLSSGTAFDLPTDAGVGALVQAVRYQRLAEIHQHKGNSECYYDPDAGYTDSRCQFEQVTGEGQQYVPQSYLRYGLELGLVQKDTSGTNLWQVGFVGATDDHNGMPGMVQEDTWNGHAGSVDDTALKRLSSESVNNPGGITGVWAEQNTRANLFAALKRRETFATSGPRIKVRFYQTWSSTDFCQPGDGGSGSSFPSNIISAGGIPMGGTMGTNPGSGPPRFVVMAAKDVVNLAEIDIIKGDVVGGHVREQVFPMALPGTQGYSQSMPCLTWQDTTYVPGAPAFYYARVLQTATPRWSSYDCDRLGGLAPSGCSAGGGLRQQIQERAWTSPIWSAP